MSFCFGIGQVKHRLQRLPERHIEPRAAADEEAGDFSFAVDDYGLRDRRGAVALCNAAVAVEGNRDVQLQTFERRPDPLGSFFQVDRDELDTLVRELGGYLFDLRHRLQAGAAPGSPKIDHQHLVLVILNTKLLAVEKIEVDWRRVLSNEDRFEAFARTGIGAVFGRWKRLGSGAQLPLLEDECGRRFVDGGADQELVNGVQADTARAEHLALAMEGLAL